MSTMRKTAETHPVRTAVRFPMRLDLRLHTKDGTVAAETENISANGILFTGSSIPDVDSSITFTITMPASIMGTPEDVSVDCTGRVVRHQKINEALYAAAIIDEYLLRG